MEDPSPHFAQNRPLYESVVLWRSEVTARVANEFPSDGNVRTSVAFVTAFLDRMETEGYTGEPSLLDAWMRGLTSLEPLADYAALIDHAVANLIALGGVLASPKLGRELLHRRDALHRIVAASPHRYEPPSKRPAGKFDAAWAAAEAVHTMVQSYDFYYGSHSRVVTDLCSTLARDVGLSDDEAEQVAIAAIVHDAGMVSVPTAILAQSEPLGSEQWELIRKHPEAGARMVEEQPLLEFCAGIVRSHHERYDGRGYPNHLRGDAIPLGARILAVADSFEALVSSRPHRAALETAAALSELRKGSGFQWDPHVVEAFVAMMERMEPAVSVA